MAVALGLYGSTEVGQLITGEWRVGVVEDVGGKEESIRKALQGELTPEFHRKAEMGGMKGRRGRGGRNGVSGPEKPMSKRPGA